METRRRSSGLPGRWCASSALLVLCLQRSVSISLVKVTIRTDVPRKVAQTNCLSPSFLTVIQFFEGSKPDHTKSWLYAVCSLSYLGAMVSSNSALQFVNYPTQVSLSGGGRVSVQTGLFSIHQPLCHSILRTVSVVSGVGEVLQAHPRSVQQGCISCFLSRMTE